MDNGKTPIEVEIQEPQALLAFGALEAPPLEKHKTLSLLSLFSGCGGMDLGFEGGFTTLKKSIGLQEDDYVDEDLGQGLVRLASTRFTTIFANDILPEARAVWKNNFQKIGKNISIFKQESVVDLVKLHEAGNAVFPEGVDIVTGGFPCQDFSLAGKRKGFESHKNHYGKIDTTTPSLETRGMLYYWMLQVIKITKPKIFVAENVKGLANLENIKAIIEDDFRGIDGGYFVFPARVLLAADYGVPQSRERIFFIGVKKEEVNPTVLKRITLNPNDPELTFYPLKSHTNSPTIKDGLLPFVTTGDVLNRLPEPDDSDDPSQMVYSKARFLRSGLQGQNEIGYNKIGPTIRAEHHGNIEFRRLSVENGGKNVDELLQGKQERRLTPRECGLIQTFPEDFVFVTPKVAYSQVPVSSSAAYKVIGNAVPPLLAYKIAKRIESLWEIYFES